MSTKASVYCSEDNSVHLYYELAHAADTSLVLRVKMADGPVTATVHVPISAELLAALHACKSVELPEGYR